MSITKKLSLFDATMLIMGSMIGSGIFLVSSSIAKEVGSSGLLLGTWAITAVMTIFGALSYGELAAMMPQAGGQYVFLKKAYHELLGFLYGWTVFAVIQTGTIAAVAVAFAKYSGVFFPSVSVDNKLLDLGFYSINTEQILGILIIWVLTFSNFRAIKSSAIVQNFFTTIKIASLLALIGIGVWAICGGIPFKSSNFSPVWPTEWNGSLFLMLGAAMVGSLFSADAWNNVTYIAQEIENPKRNLALSMVYGTGSVLLIYFFVNVAYLFVLPLDAIKDAPQGRVATLFTSTVLGNSGEWIMAVLIMISTFGCLNGIILAGARVYYAMSIDGLFFKPVQKLNKNNVPVISLVFQATWASLLVLSGGYNKLLDYVIFAVLIFYIITVSAVFKLRRTQSEVERPYKAWGYPVTSAIYLVLSIWICLSLIILKPDTSLPGLLLVLIGIPLYYYFKRKKSHELQQ